MSIRLAVVTWIGLASMIGGATSSLWAAAGEKKSRTVATVNGAAITSADIDFIFFTLNVPAEERDAYRPRVVDMLIERALIRQFLAERDIQPEKSELEAQVARLKESIHKEEKDPDQVLAKLGVNESILKQHLGVTLAWATYIRKSTTEAELKRYFQTHRSEFDGTQVRASHILIKLPRNRTAAQLREAEAKLSEVRSALVDKKLTFAEAAAKHSQAPTGAEQGGDLGFTTFQSGMTEPLMRAMFALKKGEISQPIESPFGVHLLTVTDRKPGDLSLEDARPRVLFRISGEKWKQVVSKERVKSKIERTAN